MEKALNLLILFLLSCPARGQDSQLIGGTVADPKDWPASPWVGNCSSTLVGERVLITAAHCVSDGGTKAFQIGATRYSATCTHHPAYRQNSTADWALCLVGAPVPEIPFETIAKPGEVACASAVKFLWTGFGCRVWGEGIDGKLRIGTAAATKCPSGTNYDTVTKSSVALCSGDSGGGGYLVTGGVRKYVGTNSRSNKTDTSYVSSTYTRAFFDWATAWAAGNGTKICGVHDDAARCRGAPAPLPPIPSDCKPSWQTAGLCLFAEPRRRAPDFPAECRRAIARLAACETEAEKTKKS